MPIFLPTVAPQVDPGAFEPYAFALQTTPLFFVVRMAGCKGDLPFGVDDPVPWQFSISGGPMQGVTHQTRAPAQTGQARHLPVSCDPAMRYTCYDRPDTFVAGSRRAGIHRFKYIAETLRSRAG